MRPLFLAHQVQPSSSCIKMSLAAIFFGVELYHWVAHVMVLTGTRMLPR